MNAPNFISVASSMPPKVLHDVPRISEILFIGGRWNDQQFPVAKVNELIAEDSDKPEVYHASRLATIFGTFVTIGSHSTLTTQQDIVRQLQSSRYAAAFGVDGITQL